jgi:predicted 2-oxoglutarate/Fe(II)-dependent dioxygenase YbiX
MYPPDCIFLFDDIFTAEECDYITDIINKHAVIDREVYEPSKNVLADSVNIAEILNKGEKKVCNFIMDKILHICNTFKKEYNISMSGFDTPTLRKIKGPTQLHKDGLVTKTTQDGYCKVSEIRNMSIIIALNDDYNGGELCFPEHKREIKLKMGQAVAFPPYWTHPHYTNELKNGTVRYTINCWTYNGN